MKIALITYDKGIMENSFYVQQGKAYSLHTDKPYELPGSIGNYLARNIWNIPFAFEGYYINASEGLPKLNFDVIFATAEIDYTRNYQKQGKKCLKAYLKTWRMSEQNFLSSLRKIYTHAAIIAYAKEIHPALYFSKKLIRFYQGCDIVASPYIESVRNDLSKLLNKAVYPFYYPYNIPNIRKNFLTPALQKNTVFVGASKATDIIQGRKQERGYKHSLAFAEKLAKKYNLTIVDQSKKYTWAEWLAEINAAKLCVDLDPSPRIGQLPIECAILNKLHLGSYLDAAKALYPDTACNDESRLEQIVDDYFSGENSIIEQAFNKVEERHSFESARKGLHNILSSNIDIL